MATGQVFINVVTLKLQKIFLNLQCKVAILDTWTKQKMYALKLFLERLFKAYSWHNACLVEVNSYHNACLVKMEGKFYNWNISKALFPSGFTTVTVTFLWHCFPHFDSSSNSCLILSRKSLSVMMSMHSMASDLAALSV